jgi:hypothetical protein
MSLIEDPEYQRRYRDSNELEQLAAVVYLKRGDAKLIQAYLDQSEFLQWVWRAAHDGITDFKTGVAG